MTTVDRESIFLAHPAVKKAALIGAGPKNSIIPLMLIEPAHSLSKKREIEVIKELRALAENNPKTKDIKQFHIVKIPFPVDVRHNIKIDRIELTKWANKEELYERRV